MASNIYTDKPPKGDHLMSFYYSYGGTLFQSINKDDPNDGFNYISTPTANGDRCIRPEIASLAQALGKICRFRSAPPAKSKLTHGMRDAHTLLKEVPWAGGTSNKTLLQASGLKEPVATLTFAYKPIKVVPSVISIDRYGDGTYTPFTTCAKDPLILVGTDRAIIFPQTSMTELLKTVCLSNKNPEDDWDRNDPDNWIDGEQCILDFKNSVAAQAGTGTGRADSRYINVDGGDTVLSYRGP